MTPSATDGRGVELDRSQQAAPRTDLDNLLAREELENSGVYFLFGADSESGDPLAYIGEAEVVRDRLKQHRSKDFWVSVVVFVSKDENLTKAHIRYLENRLIEEAKKVNRYRLENSNLTSARLPESDREDMEVFLSRIQQMLPVLGSDIFTPITGSAKPTPKIPVLYCKSKGAAAKGHRTETGFVVLAGSTAVLKERPSAASRHPIVVRIRRKLIDDATLVEKAGFYVFQKDTEFSSPSLAAAVIQGGAAGPIAWKDERGKTLKKLEEG